MLSRLRSRARSPPWVEMTDERYSFHWRPGDGRGPVPPSLRGPHGANSTTGSTRRSSGGSSGLSGRLGQRIRPLVLDRASSSDALVREIAALVLEWLGAAGEDLDRGFDWANLHRVWTSEMDAFRESQGWRAPVAHFLETIDALPRFARDARLDAAPRDVLAEELGLWLGGLELAARAGAHAPTWSGVPLDPGVRMPERALCANAIASEFEHGETVCIHGYSSTTLAVLSLLAQRGLEPRVVLSEGAPDLSGRRMAKELLPLGVRVRLTYDAGLASELKQVDRVWIGTEAIGPEGLLARVGTSLLFQEARRLEVPTAVLATADKWMPRGELCFPQWCEKDPWLLWEGAPEGVDLASQAFERLPLALVDVFATEAGFESAPEFSLRALRTQGAFAEMTT